MKVFTFANFGYEETLVEVEVDLRRGIPAVDIVGLADAQVKETRERVRSAISNSGLEFPPERVLISFSPADIRKDGAQNDLPMAIAILKASNNIDGDDVMVLGELELDGHVRAVRNVYGAVRAAIDAGIRKFIIPQLNENELKSFDGIQYIPALDLAETFEHFKKGEYVTMQKDINFEHTEVFGVDFPIVPEDVDEFMPGYDRAIRALQIAAAGNHHILFTGAPGSGKTLLLQKLKYLLPCLTEEEAQTVTRIQSLAGLIRPNDSLVRERPFRMPHQTASIEGICGGGPNCRPGEISLAHNGTLFFDEAAEFRSSVIQMLRVPLENGTITLSRAGRSTTFPARFQLAMALNPCPCGCYGTHNMICLCSASSVEMYWRKISAPLMDRIDIRMFVEKNETQQGHHTITELRGDIAKAVLAQRKRGKSNSDIQPMEFADICKLDKETQSFLEHCELTPRAYNCVMKVSRTIADMAGSEEIKKEYVEEAYSYRKELFGFNF